MHRSDSDSESLFALIGRTYDAALDARVWPEVVAAIAALQRSDKALLFTPAHAPAQGGFVFAAGISESALQQWAARYIQNDLWLKAAMSKGLVGEGNVFTDGELIPHHELLRTDHYRLFLRAMGIARLCAGSVFGAEAKAALPTGISIYRDVKDPAFGSRERDVLRILLPHISRSLGIMYRLRNAELKAAATLAALDRLASAVLLFGANRAVLFANRAARSALREENGLRLKVTPQGKALLAASTVDAQRALDAALDLCLDPAALEVPHFSEVVRINRPLSSEPIALNFSALPVENEFGSGAERPLAIAFLSDPITPVKIDNDLLQRLYELTPAECRLAAQLYLGGSLIEIAGRLGVSDNTVKSQMRSLFAKTGVNRQADLVKALYALHSTIR